jgi:hypothetical protein
MIKMSEIKMNVVIDKMKGLVCVLFVLYHVFYVAGLLRLINIYPTIINYRAGSLCLILLVSLLFLPKNKKASFTLS